MKRRRVITTALVAGFAGTVLLLSTLGSSASAQSPTRFESFLQTAGFGVVSTGPVNYAGINQPGEALTVSRGDSTTQVVEFEYSDDAKLRQDWDVEAGKPVTPLAGGFVGDLADDIAMYDVDAILVFNIRPPNDPLFVKGVGQAFLSMPAPSSSGQPGVAPVPSNPNVLPPHTGSGGPFVTHHRQLPLWAGLLWTGATASAIVLAAAGGLVLLMKVRRLT